ncbi:MAG TPA: hypothetical protein VFN57_01375 [Thermomicrobiaceae bacterium]|nr:hypothetical protein [Thermomicrobiaceae bacterium]
MSDRDQFLVLMAALLAMVVVFFRYTGRRRAPAPRTRPTVPDDRRPTVLVLSAAVGGGHNAAASAVAAALEAAGWRTATLDALQQMSPQLDAALRWGYATMLRRAPWLYEIAFRCFALPGMRDLIRLGSGLLYGGRLLRIVEETRPALVVSTYPVLTATLGYLRRRGRLSVPAVGVVSDYGVHPMWVAPGIDQHLFVSSISTPAARVIGSRVAVVEPLVGPEFREAPSRADARAALGLPPDEFLALIVGGAWGIGDLEGAAERAVRAGVAAVIVTGHNDALRRRLTRRFAGAPRVRVQGWTSEMPRLLAAADCLIQNAGGVTCLEAIHCRVPILIYEAVPGHGRLNAEMMERAGAATWIRRPEDLEATLRAAADGRAPLPPPRPEPARPVAAAVLETLRPAPAATTSAGGAPRWSSPVRRTLAGVATVVLLVLLSLSSWSVALAARGLRMDVPGANPAPGLVSVGVLATDPATARAVEQVVVQQHLPVTVFVDRAAVAGLTPASGVVFGVAEDPHASVISAPWQVRGQVRDAARALRAATGSTAHYFLPARQDVNLTALAVMPQPAHLVFAEPRGTAGIQPGVYVIDLSGMPPDVAVQTIRQRLDVIQGKGLRCVSLAQLAS